MICSLATKGLIAKRGWFCKAAVRKCACMQSHERMRQHYCVPACVCVRASACLFVRKSHVAWGHRGQMVCTLPSRVCVTPCSCLSRLELNLCDDAANTVTSSRINSIPHKEPAYIPFTQIMWRAFCGDENGREWTLIYLDDMFNVLWTQIAHQSQILHQLVVKTTYKRSLKYKHDVLNKAVSKCTCCYLIFNVSLKAPGEPCVWLMMKSRARFVTLSLQPSLRRSLCVRKMIIPRLAVEQLLGWIKDLLWGPFVTSQRTDNQ